MDQKYDLHSEFDIFKHKETYVHYLEVVVDSNGKVMYAVPSHQEKLIALCMEKLQVTRNEVADMIPIEYYFDVLTWLIENSGAIAVWEGFCQYSKRTLTQEQIDTMTQLKQHGLYIGDIPAKEEY